MQHTQGDDTEAVSYPTDDKTIQVQATIFSAAVPVPRLNSTTHTEDLFFALFQPSHRPHWAGNVKRYRLAIRNGPNNESEAVIYDADGKTAIDPQTGLFVADSTSVWTPTQFSPDGADIARGGLASRLYRYDADAPIASSRKVYTYVGLNQELTHTSNALHEHNIADGVDPNKALTKIMFAATELSDAAFVELLQWARGVDVDDEDGDGDSSAGRLRLGSPLHSRPVVVTYGSNPTNGEQQDVLFVATNAGYLHAAVIDTKNATAQLEQFAFVPPDMLSKLINLKNNQTGAGDPSSLGNLSYGLDGGLEVWIDDHDGDGNIEPSEDHVYVYLAQRRGGRNYYALEVTDLSAPRLLWRIEGGATGFEELGQSWSRPVHARLALRIKGDDHPVIRDVLIFGGGYDTQHDQAQRPRSDDHIGRAIYIVDARTGALLWWTGPSGHPGDPDQPTPDMRYAIASEVTVIDSDGDGLDELLLVGDLGGQLWRFDVADGVIAGGTIADLQDDGDGTPGPVRNRRFFEPPDAAVVSSTAAGDYLAIAIGSGYRAHPLDMATEEAMFLLRQPLALSETGLAKITAGDLLDITERPQLAGELDPAEYAQYRNGWRLSLRDTATREFVGEKILAPPLLANGLVMFTTYTPQPGPDGPGPGRTRFYAIEIEDGAPTPDLHDSAGEIGQLKVDDRFEDLSPGNPLPTAPTVIFPPHHGATPVVLVGTHISRLKLTRSIMETFWYQDDVH